MTSATMYDGVGVAPGRYRADGYRVPATVRRSDCWHWA